MVESRIGRLAVVVSLIRSPAYQAIMTGAALLYFLIFYNLITASNYGIFLVTIPIYLVYIMVASAGFLLSLSVFSIKTALLGRASAAGEGALSAILPTVGSLVATCACSYSLLASLLAFIGINAFEISSVVSSISLYQLWLIIAIIAINLVMIFYYLGKVANAANRLHPKKREMLSEEFRV